MLLSSLIGSWGGGGLDLLCLGLLLLLLGGLGLQGFLLGDLLLLGLLLGSFLCLGLSDGLLGSLLSLGLDLPLLLLLGSELLDDAIKIAESVELGSSDLADNVEKFPLGLGLLLELLGPRVEGLGLLHELLGLSGQLIIGLHNYVLLLSDNLLLIVDLGLESNLGVIELLDLVESDLVDILLLVELLNGVLHSGLGLLLLILHLLLELLGESMLLDDLVVLISELLLGLSLLLGESLEFLLDVLLGFLLSQELHLDLLDGLFLLLVL